LPAKISPVIKPLMATLAEERSLVLQTHAAVVCGSLAQKSNQHYPKQSIEYETATRFCAQRDAFVCLCLCLCLRVHVARLLVDFCLP
jgi:hypothetical protein